MKTTRNALIIAATLLTLGGAAQAQQTVSPAVFSALTAAQKAEQPGELARAQQALKPLLHESKEDSLERALIEQRLGYLAIARNRNQEAIEWLSKALSRDKLEPQAARQDRLNLAQLMAGEGQYREAARVLEAEHARQPLGNEPKRLLVQVYSRAKQYDKAIPLAEQVVRAEPGIESAWYQMLVGMNYQLKRYQQAEQWQKVLLKREPNNVAFWRQLAGIQSLDNRQQAAAGTLRLAHEGGVSFPARELDNLVALQLNAGAPWQAARLLEALMQERLVPVDAARKERLAQLWHQARDRERARAAWASLAAESGRPDHWLRLASIQLEAGEWSDLLASLERAQAGASAEQQRQIRQWGDYARSARDENNS